MARIFAPSTGWTYGSRQAVCDIFAAGSRSYKDVPYEDLKVSATFDFAKRYYRDTPWRVSTSSCH
ncbi:MAG: hypothetical protein L0Y68_02290 [Candidatus Dadabacteria bacterium]|nr:hypothetical protein [Candidatus Dadabacteria bacterium]